VWTSDGLYKPLEELFDEWLKLGDVANVQNFEKLLEEHSLFTEVGEWPVS
jgi:hypothetical protein